MLLSDGKRFNRFRSRLPISQVSCLDEWLLGSQSPDIDVSGDCVHVSGRLLIVSLCLIRIMCYRRRKEIRGNAVKLEDGDCHKLKARDNHSH